MENQQFRSTHEVPKQPAYEQVHMSEKTKRAITSRELRQVEQSKEFNFSSINRERKKLSCFTKFVQSLRMMG